MTRDLREFPETRWSQRLPIRDPGQPGYTERPEDLVRRYWTPADHYLRAIRPCPAQDAEERIQQIFAMLVSRGQPGTTLSRSRQLPQLPENRLATLGCQRRPGDAGGKLRTQLRDGRAAAPEGPEHRPCPDGGLEASGLTALGALDCRCRAIGKGARRGDAGAAAGLLEALSINRTLHFQIGDRGDFARRNAAELDAPR